MTFHASIRSRSGESKPGADGFAAGLNPQQSSAVRIEHEASGPILVLAGAGSGKTTVLARRIARQVLLDGEGGHILALTFTKDAAGEMKDRVEGLLSNCVGATGISRPRFGTFHAFAYGLLRAAPSGVPNWRRLGFSRSPTLLDPSAQNALLATLPGKEGAAGSPEALARLLANPFGPDPVGEAGEPARRLRSCYRERLLAEGALAFDDMVTLALRLLREHPEALAAARSATRRVLVDEFQDTSPDQLDLVKFLLADGRSLFLVGDDDQAIYGFRGADPGNIGRARELFPGLRILKLEVNYRSTPPIVAYANGVFRAKPEHLRKALRPGRSLPEGFRPSAVQVKVHEDGPSQGAFMVAEMRRLMREEGLQWKDFAVLYRVNSLEVYYRSLVAELAGAAAAEALTFATVHASKGLQYPAVFLVGLEDGVLPFRSRGEAPDPARLAEERRIFYVGVTRAERHLWLCAVRRRMVRGKLKEWKPSPFLAVRPAAAGSAASGGIPGRAPGWVGRAIGRIFGWRKARV